MKLQCVTLFASSLTCILLNESMRLVNSFTWTSDVKYVSPSQTQTNNIFKQPKQRQTVIFAGGGFGTKKPAGPSKTKKMMNHNQAKKATQQLTERYGGDIKTGTISRINAALSSLPPHLKEATSLYKKLTQFDALIAPMTETDRKRLIPSEQWKISSRDRSRLQELMEKHSFTETNLHNIYQEITWDASADAKATNADIAGNKMKGDLQNRITKACSIAVETVTKANVEGGKGKLLDVGCGHGSIVPSLVGLPLDSYVGIDLSKEMIKNAIQRYGDEKNKLGRGRVFVSDDFLTHDFSVYVEPNEKDTAAAVAASDGVFEAVIFCSSLHDLPDMESCIGKAVSVLRSGGALVVVHAQGAMVCSLCLFNYLADTNNSKNFLMSLQHVLGQHQSNPVMVQRGLPTTTEWMEMICDHGEWKVTLEVEPADPRTERDENDGYLAVLRKL